MKSFKQVSVKSRSLYLKMNNCGFDKPCVELKVIESLSLLNFQAFLSKKYTNQQ